MSPKLYKHAYVKMSIQDQHYKTSVKIKPIKMSISLFLQGAGDWEPGRCEPRHQAEGHHLRVQVRIRTRLRDIKDHGTPSCKVRYLQDETQCITIHNS